MRPITILLVEEDLGDVMLTRAAFEDHKVANPLHVVHDGHSALRFVRREFPFQDAPRPGLILLDLSLPGLDGREVLERLAVAGELRDIQVVILTSSTAEEDIVRGLALQASDYASKPVDFAPLADLGPAPRRPLLHRRCGTGTGSPSVCRHAPARNGHDEPTAKPEVPETPSPGVRPRRAPPVRWPASALAGMKVLSRRSPTGIRRRTRLSDLDRCSRQRLFTARSHGRMPMVTLQTVKRVVRPHIDTNFLTMCSPPMVPHDRRPTRTVGGWRRSGLIESGDRTAGLVTGRAAPSPASIAGWLGGATSCAHVGRAVLDVIRWRQFSVPASSASSADGGQQNSASLASRHVPDSARSVQQVEQRSQLGLELAVPVTEHQSEHGPQTGLVCRGRLGDAPGPGQDHLDGHIVGWYSSERMELFDSMLPKDWHRKADSPNCKEAGHGGGVATGQ